MRMLQAWRQPLLPMSQWEERSLTSLVCGKTLPAIAGRGASEMEGVVTGVAPAEVTGEEGEGRGRAVQAGAAAAAAAS